MKINRMNDRFFKAIFGDDQHKNRALNLINAFFEFEGTKLIKDIKFEDRELDPEYNSGKLAVLDILGVAEDGTKINVELQSIQHKSFVNRIMHYWSKLYTRTLLKGEQYDKLNRTVSINILNFELFTEYKDYHSMYGIYNSKNYYKLTDQLEIHFLEIGKWEAKNIKEMKRLDKWIAYFSNEYDEKQLEAIGMSEPTILDVLEAEKLYMQNPKLRSEYEYREDELRRYLTDIEGYRKEGLEEGFKLGIEQGIERGIEQTAMEMLRDKIDIDTVAKYTKLSVNDIRKLMKNLY